MIEHLEDRIAPASIVITTSGAGMKVHGATPADTLSLIFEANVTGGFDLFDPISSDTITVNGATTSPTSNGYTLHFPNITGDITVTGGASAAGNLLEFLNQPSQTGVFGGKITANLPAGNNQVAVGVADIGGALLVTTGPGNDQMVFTDNTHVGGVTKLSLGNGNNSVGPATNLAALSFGGSFNYIGGTGSDNVNLTIGANGGQGLSVFGNLNYLPGDGASTLMISSPNVSIGGSLTIKEGNTPSGQSSSVSINASGSTNPYLAFDVGANLTWSAGPGSHIFNSVTTGFGVGGKLNVSEGGNGFFNIQAGVAEIGSIKGVVLPAKGTNPAGSGSFGFDATGGSGGILRVGGSVSLTGFSAVGLNAIGSIAGSVAVSGETSFLMGTSNGPVPLEIGGSVKVTPLNAAGSSTFTGIQNLRLYGSLAFNGGASADTVLLDSDQIFGSTKLSMGLGADTVHFFQDNNVTASLYAGAVTVDFGAETSPFSDTFTAAGSGLPIQFLGAVKILHDGTSDTISPGTASNVHYAIPLVATP